MKLRGVRSRGSRVQELGRATLPARGCVRRPGRLRTPYFQHRHAAPSRSHDPLLLGLSPVPLPEDGRRGWKFQASNLVISPYPGAQPVTSLGQRTLLTLRKFGWVWEPWARNQERRPRHPRSWFTLGPAVLTQGKAGLIGPQSHSQALPAPATGVPSCPPPEGPVPKMQPDTGQPSGWAQNVTSAITLKVK